MRVPIFASAAALCVLMALSLAHAEEEDPQVIGDGSKVSVEYTLTLDDGTKADSNVGGEPLVYQHGAEEMLPAFEQQLTGMHVDEEKEFTLAATDGYGEVDPSLRQEVEAEQVPEDGREVGTRLVTQDPEGNQRLITVHSVEDDKITLDFNHPLAGENLNFDVKILAID